MNNITLKVELLAGTDFKKAVSEARDLAQNLGIAFVCFSFNGIEVSVSRRVDPEMLYEEFLAALKPESEYKSIVG